MQLLSTREMSEADRLTIASGIPGLYLMERAGEAVAKAVEARQHGPHRVLALAGPGNNGGDAWIAALKLAERGYQVHLLSYGPLGDLKGDAREMAERYKSAGLPFTENLQKMTPAEITPSLSPRMTIIDGIFGAGLARPVTGELAALITHLNDYTSQHQAALIAIDVPTGLSGDSGQMLGAAFQASSTVTFFRPKPGHYLLPGRQLCGELAVRDIGIPERQLDIIRPKTCLNTPSLWQAAAAAHTPPAHKYQNGNAVIISGRAEMQGAAALAANAALRAGAGLVTTALEDPACPPATLLAAVMTAEKPEPAALSDWVGERRFTSLLIGPGSAPDGETRQRVTACLVTEAAIVLDAGALSAFEDEAANLISSLKAREKIPTILTPHEGEFRRLFGYLIEENGRPKAARKAAAETGAVIILKGADTVIAAPDGRAAINNNAPPTLASAGTGDVLAGITLACLARGYPAFEAAARAVYLHGAAANHIATRLAADDLIAALPVAEAIVESYCDDQC